LVAYAGAYVPLADELEALAQFIRYSTTAARNLAGTEALTTYALAQRLAKEKRYAYLKPHVADMRRALRPHFCVACACAGGESTLARSGRTKRVTSSCCVVTRV
jgi:hypothetical protein